MGKHGDKDNPQDKVDYQPKHAKDSDATPTVEIPKVKDPKEGK